MQLSTVAQLIEETTNQTKTQQVKFGLLLSLRGKPEYQGEKTSKAA